MSSNRHGATTIMRKWRLQGAAPPEPPWFQGEHEIGTPWLHLQYAHNAVRALGPAVQRELPERFSELERLCVLQPELGRFYHDAYVAPHDEPLPPSSLPPEDFTDATWHFVTLQVRFAEYVYTELALWQYANAPANRGWMNLFRQWGRSARFDSVLTHLAPTLREDFVHFYRWFLRDYDASIDAEPVPHPWDSQVRRLDSRALRALDDKPMARHTSSEVQSAIEYLPGCFLDSGRHEARPEHVVRTGGPPSIPRTKGKGATYPIDVTGYLIAFATPDPDTHTVHDEPPPPADTRGGPGGRG